MTRASTFEPDGQALSSEQRGLFAPIDALPPLKNTVHLALEDTPIRCGPRQTAYYKPDLNTRFDRNNCSTIHAQEPMVVLADWPGEMQLVRTRYSIGWIPDDAALSPAIEAGLAKQLARNPGAATTQDSTVTAAGASVVLKAGTILPVADDGSPRVASKSGLAKVSAPVQHASRPLSRRAVLQEAFAHVNDAYGWGGQDSGLDCSRFLMEVFAGFGLQLPRFSGHQALAGTFSVDVSKARSDKDKLLLIDEANKKGLVLLYFPGHIMLYLGRDAGGQPMAIHSFAEYAEPCDGGGETIVENNNVTVTNLDLGRGSSRTAFIERITRIAVIGKSPGLELDGIAEFRGAVRIARP